MSTSEQMKNQYDETTRAAALEYANKWGVSHDDLPMFNGGRNSAKGSLEILARALEHSSSHSFYCIVEGRPTAKPGDCYACDAIAEVRARGDWPL